MRYINIVNDNNKIQTLVKIKREISYMTHELFTCENRRILSSLLTDFGDKRKINYHYLKFKFKKALPNKVSVRI